MTSRKAKRNKAAEKPKYWLRLTRACNNNCVFCLDKENRTGTFLPVHRIARELREGRKAGAEKLILSGGEPTLHPGYLKIVQSGKEAGYREIQTVTNGRMFAYRNFLRKAVENGLTETTFSFHGDTAELYEKQSLIRGSYEQALAGLTNALNTGKLIVNIDIVMNRINYRYLERIILFFIRLGVKEFDLLQVVPFGAAWENREKVFYDLDRAAPFLRKAFALQHRFPHIYLWTNRLPAPYLEGFEELIQHPVKLYDEIRGRKRILERFLEKNILMKCHDAQCPYCFIRDFCKDLMELKKEGRIKGRGTAFCLSQGKDPAGKEFNAKTGIILEKFLAFFIEHRYFVKSLRCRQCSRNAACPGAPINLIREKGFAVLRPFKARAARRGKV